MSIRFVVLIMLAVMAVEVVVLTVGARRSSRVPAIRTLLPNLAAGAFLVLALGATTTADPLPAVALFVLLAGIAHAADLAIRLRGRPRR